MSVLIPESNEVRAEKAAYSRQVEQASARIREIERGLKSIDPSLSLICAKPGADEIGLLPGRWHVVKAIPDAPDEYWPLVGPNDEYREPGAWVLDEFKAADLWDPRVHRDKKEARRKLKEAKERATRLEREQRADHLKQDVEAIQRLRSEAGIERRTDLKASKETLEARKRRSGKLAGT